MTDLKTRILQLKAERPREFWLEIGNECDDIVWRKPVNERTVHVQEVTHPDRNTILSCLKILAEALEDVATCICDEAYLSRQLVDPNCNHQYQDTLLMVNKMLREGEK